MADEYQIGEYDRELGKLDGLPGSLRTKPVVNQVVGFTGVASTFIVRTVRLQDRDAEQKAGKPEFVVFLECHSPEQNIRLVIPPKVTELIDRQRDGLTRRAIKIAATRAAATRKARGIVPQFGKGKRSKAR